MGLKELLLSKLLGLNETENSTPWFLNETPREIPPHTITPTPTDLTVAPTLEPSQYTFAPVGPLKTYVLRTAARVNQMQNLKPYEQAETKFSLLAATKTYNYMLVETDAKTAAKLVGDLYQNSQVPPLKQISSKAPKCPVEIDDKDAAIWVIGSLDDLSDVESNIGASGTTQDSNQFMFKDATPYSKQNMFKLKDAITSARESPVTSYRLKNPRFTGIDIVAYAPNVGEVTAQSTTNLVALFTIFGNVIKQIGKRGAKYNHIAFFGSISHPLIADFIHDFNKTTIPVDFGLDDPLTKVLGNFFAKHLLPGLTLDRFKCPEGKQFKLDKYKLRPHRCLEEFPIYGPVDSKINYKLQFTINTNRWYSVQIAVQRDNSTTLARFNMIFNREGLTLTNQNSSGAVTSADIRDPQDNNSTLVFDYPGLVAGGPYEVQIKAEQLGLKQVNNIMEINVRKLGKKNFNNVGLANVNGKPMAAKICAFTPPNLDGVFQAQTILRDVSTAFIGDNSAHPQTRRRVAAPRPQ